jgi:N-acetylglucosaminyldiphosphoundecaprenol N-acetyl-beta-D-mannosaminyltransferase
MDNSPRKVKRWGISFNPISKSEFIAVIDKYISLDSGKPLHITGVNPETISQSLKDPLLLDAINDSDLVNIDNTLVLLMLRLSGVKAPERVATPDLFESMLDLAHKKDYSIYLLGAKEEILIKAIENIRFEYPGIKIAGYRNGYYKKEKIREVCDEIEVAMPKMLFLAFPTPEKELFIRNFKYHLGVPVLLGVGGAIDVKAGLVTRAPLYLRNIGLEGIHRALQNPLNYGKRYFTLYPSCIAFALKELFKKNKNN